MNDILLQQWMNDVKYVYIEQNIYVEPKFEIIKCIKIEKKDFPHCNSIGWWGNEKDGIHRLWCDFTIYNIDTDEEELNGVKVFPKQTRLVNVIKSAFLLVKADWLLKNRREKIKYIKNDREYK